MADAIEPIHVILEELRTESDSLADLLTHAETLGRAAQAQARRASGGGRAADAWPLAD